MPIQPGMQTTPISYEDFHALDYQVMGIVFAIHRDLGRFWNEKIYQNERAYRCQKAGYENVATEVLIHVSFEDFVKVYKIDLLINNVIYENHFRQFIKYTSLKAIQWVNFNHDNVVFKTLLK